MKTDTSTNIIRKMGVDIGFKNINKIVKDVIMRFADGEVIVHNDNFGTRRKYMSFTEGKKNAGLDSYIIVFSGLESACILDEEFIDKDGNRRKFSELKQS